MSFLIKNYMNKEVLTIEARVSVSEAAKIISRSDEGYLIVLKDGRPTGIVTEIDFVKKVLAPELDPTKVSVGEIMSSPIKSITPDEGLLKASEVMREQNIRRLPVIKNGIIYGIITSKDIAEHCGTYADQLTRDLIKWTTLLPTDF